MKLNLSINRHIILIFSHGPKKVDRLEERERERETRNLSLDRDTLKRLHLKLYILTFLPKTMEMETISTPLQVFPPFAFYYQLYALTCISESNGGIANMEEQFFDLECKMELTDSSTNVCLNCGGKYNESGKQCITVFKTEYVCDKLIKESALTPKTFNVMSESKYGIPDLSKFL